MPKHPRTAAAVSQRQINEVSFLPGTVRIQITAFPGEYENSPDAAAVNSGFKEQGKSEPGIHSEMGFLLQGIAKEISKMIMQL